MKVLMQHGLRSIEVEGQVLFDIDLGRDGHSEDKHLWVTVTQESVLVEYTNGPSVTGQLNMDFSEWAEFLEENQHE